MAKRDGSYSTTGRVPYQLTPEMADLMERRTSPFLDHAGLMSRPITKLLQEAYLQGLTDAVDAMNSKEAASDE